MVESRVIFGGWYQRTTLHLSEVQRFLTGEKNNIELSEEKLNNFKKGLGLKSVKRVSANLEYLDIHTESGIRIKYFEDGLYTLSANGEDFDGLSKKIRKYFDVKFRPAFDYLFSLGAPTPKILSNMKDDRPFIIERISSDPKKIIVDKKFGEVYLETSSAGIKVSKTRNFIFVDMAQSKKGDAESLSEMQIFFSDFKLQLHRYLDIHRKIWEEIDDIGKKRYVLGKDVGEYRARLDSYQKTIQLIKNRINQMSNYAKTRRNISKQVRLEDDLINLFQYRFEDLFDTLDYIKEIWNMTLDYVNSAIRVIGEVESSVNSKGIGSIKFLVGVGVVSGILRYLEPAELPEVALSGIVYVLTFGFLAIGLNKIIKWKSGKKKYTVSFVERAEKI